MAQVPLLYDPILDGNGDPYSGALIYIYEAGTTTPISFYTDAALTSAASNPLVCDSAGLPPVAYAAPDEYKLVFKTAADVTISTVDDYSVIDPATATAVASTTISSNTSVSAEDLDRLFNIDASAGDVTLTADSATLGSGFRFSARLSSSSNNGIVQPVGGQTINGSSSFTFGTQFDSATFVSNGAGGWDILAQTLDTAQLVSDNAIQKLQVAIGAGRLEASSATVVTFKPFKGGYVCFPNGTSIAIGSAGITSTYNNATINGTAAQTLTANTTYFAYVYNNAGTLVIDWSTTGHTADTTTGIEIKIGDITRVLVGMVRTNASSQFDNSATLRNVASWNNRRAQHMVNAFTVDRAYSSASWGEVNTEIRCEFLSWGDAVSFMCNAVLDDIPNTNNEFRSAVTLDGDTTPVIQSAFSDADGSFLNSDDMGVVSGGWFSVSEGHHYATIMAQNQVAESVDYTPASTISGMVTI